MTPEKFFKFNFKVIKVLRIIFKFNQKINIAVGILFSTGKRSKDSDSDNMIFSPEQFFILGQKCQYLVSVLYLIRSYKIIISAHFTIIF